MVVNKNGKANLIAINTTSEDINLIIPPLTLEAYDGTLKPVRVIKTTVNPQDEVERQLRIDRVIELLDLKDLSPKERTSIV